MDKITETDLLRVQLAHANVTIAAQARDALNADLVRRYGEPGEMSIQWQPDGTIVRAAKLESVPNEEVSGG